MSLLDDITDLCAMNEMVQRQLLDLSQGMGADMELHLSLCNNQINLTLSKEAFKRKNGTVYTPSGHAQMQEMMAKGKFLDTVSPYAPIMTRIFQAVLKAGGVEGEGNGALVLATRNGGMVGDKDLKKGRVMIDISRLRLSPLLKGNLSYVGQYHTLYLKRTLMALSMIDRRPGMPEWRVRGQANATFIAIKAPSALEAAVLSYTYYKRRICKKTDFSIDGFDESQNAMLFQTARQYYDSQRTAPLFAFENLSDQPILS